MYHPSDNPEQPAREAKNQPTPGTERARARAEMDAKIKRLKEMETREHKGITPEIIKWELTYMGIYVVGFAIIVAIVGREIFFFALFTLVCTWVVYSLVSTKGILHNYLRG